MELLRLDGRFVCFVPASQSHPVSTWREVATLDEAQGVLFQCPWCARDKVPGSELEDGELRYFFRGAHYVLCWFTNPRVLPPVPDDIFPGPGRWTISADTAHLDNISFCGPGAASVHITASDCGWHGFIRNGEATLT